MIKRPAPSVDESEDQVHGEKHESDRGIYTVTIKKSGNQSTAPIKLKRPPPILTTVSEKFFFLPSTLSLLSHRITKRMRRNE